MPADPELNNLFESWLSAAAALSREAAASIESRMAFCEKLLLLDGGTLTLTFTVLAYLGSQLRGVNQRPQATSDLIFALWLLVSSAIVCLTHNFFGVTALKDAKHAAHFRLLEIKHRRMNAELSARNQALETPLNIKPELDKVERAFLRGDTFIAYLMVVAQVLTTMAFIALLVFVQANAKALLNLPT